MADAKVISLAERRAFARGRSIAAKLLDDAAESIRATERRELTLSAARGWLRTEAATALSLEDRQLAYVTLIALKSGDPLPAPCRRYLERHASSRHPMRARWAKLVLEELETP